MITTRTRTSSPDLLPMATVALSAMMILLLLLPFVALLWRAVDAIDGSFQLDVSPIVSALWLSLGTTAVATLIIFLFGTPLALALARYDFPLKRIVTVLVEIPIVMPPVVAGLALLAAFGRRGLVGAPLASVGLSVTFTWVAVVLAQVFVAVPFYIRAAQSRFKALPQDLAAAASIDGANHWQTFWLITLPLSRPALLAGLVLSWARALGEFGATILFAGNMQGRTQTMPLLVYGALEQDLRAAYGTAVILLTLAALALLITRWLSKLDETHADPLADA